jgi:hypothetical protein
MALYPATLTGPTLLMIGATVADAAEVYDSDNPVTSGSAQTANVTIVKQIIACNTDSAARTFSLYLDSDGTVAIADTLFEGVSLAIGETKIINTSIVLRADDNQKLHARASVDNKVVLTLVGLEEY